MGRHGPPGLSSSERAELWSRWKAGCHVRQIARAFGRDHGRVRAAYNYADHLPQRKVMMQDWVEYLDRLRGARSEFGFDVEQLPLDNASARPVEQVCHVEHAGPFAVSGPGSIEDPRSDLWHNSSNN
jgi:hypothetical protein